MVSLFHKMKKSIIFFFCTVYDDNVRVIVSMISIISLDHTNNNLNASIKFFVFGNIKQLHLGLFVYKEFFFFYFFSALPFSLVGVFLFGVIYFSTCSPYVNCRIRYIFLHTFSLTDSSLRVRCIGD